MDYKSNYKDKMNRLTDTTIENNRFLLCSGIIAIILTMAYALEVVKGSRTLGYYAVFLLFLWIPYICSVISYKHDSDNAKMKYIECYGYLVFYIYVLLTSSTDLDFVYIFPMLVAMYIYQDYKLVIRVGLPIIAAVLLSIVLNLIKLKDYSALAVYEIQAASTCIVIIISLITIRSMEFIANRRLNTINAEKNKQDDMLATITTSTDSIYDKVSGVNEESSMISEVANKNKEALAGIVDRITELSAIVSTQLEKSQMISEQTDSVTAITEDVMKKFAETMNTVESGNIDVEKLAAASESGKLSNEAVKSSISELVAKSEEVKDILTIISSITNQTTLLSLNASIESARAGEAGKGFAVVAEQIKNLAAETQNATNNIAQILAELSDKTTEASNRIDELTHKNDEQLVLVSQTRDAFQNIKNNIDTMSSDIAAQSKHMSEAAAANHDISLGISDLNTFSHELMNNAENTRSLTENTLSGTSRISGILKDITAQIANLQELQHKQDI